MSLPEAPKPESEQEPGIQAIKDPARDPVEGHVNHVCELAVTLFDNTCSLHELNDESRWLLEKVAKLHQMRLPRGKKKLLKAARQLIRDQIHSELSPEVESVATSEKTSRAESEAENVAVYVVALQHGQIKRKAVAKSNLSPVSQREALTLAAILKIAIGLDESKSHMTAIEKVLCERDKVYIVVSGPETLIDAQTAQREARLWTTIGYPTIHVLEISEAQHLLIPYPEPMETMGIVPADDLAEAGRKVMRYHFAEMLRHEAGTRQGVDIEALHDMRVATRRMRAAFEVFSEAFDPGALKLHLKGLRATGRALGQVRDLDVFMEEAQRFMATLPEGQSSGLDPLLYEWKNLREKTRDEMLAYLDSQNYLDFKKKFNLFVNTPGAGAKPMLADLPAPQKVNEIAPVFIYERLANVRAFESIIGIASVQELHALRIEFKKLRYTVEYFREVLGEEAKLVINELKGLQDHLGELNDAQVASQLLQDFLDRWHVEQKKKGNIEYQEVELVQVYLAYRQNQREQLIGSFPEAWRKFTASEFRRNLALAVSVL